MSAFQARSLQDLHALRKALADRAAREARLQQERAEAERRARAEQNLFQTAIGPVTALAGQHNRRWHAPEPPLPLPVQRELDEQRVLIEAISDEFDVSTLLDVDDQLSFRRPGIGRDVTHKLRAGHWSIQRQLDLHGLRTDEAREALGHFIRLAHRTGLRCVRIVHGKGLGSPAGHRCSRAASSAGWYRKRKCWPLCRRARPKAALARWWCCCSLCCTDI